MMNKQCNMCTVIEQIKRGENPWFVKEFKTGYAVLGWNQHFNGYTLFICKKHVTELFELDEDYRMEYCNEMSFLAQAVKIAFGAEKINYECLGNGDAHLHWHIFPRKSGDLGEFGMNGKGPVWWLPPEIMLDENNKPNAEELEQMKTNLNSEIEKLLVR